METLDPRGGASLDPQGLDLQDLCRGSVRVYAVIISKYATKIVGTQKRQVACVHGMQDQKQSTFNTFKPAQW